jgi:hypothetical protein
MGVGGEETGAEARRKSSFALSLTLSREGKGDLLLDEYAIDAH